MKKLLLAIPIAMLMLSVAPQPAAANECIDGCKADFPGTRPDEVSLRGWCYIIRACLAE